ncbi:MAG: hypothetical protein L3J80_02595 [Thermoplasmata archaeon]|nr:hypothetical protein [Thermoplasmata archaeon]
MVTPTAPSAPRLPAWWWTLLLGGVVLAVVGSQLVQPGSAFSFVLVGGALVLVTLAILTLQRGIGSMPPLMGVRGPRIQGAFLTMIFGLLGIAAVGTAVWAITGFGWILYVQIGGAALLEVVVIARLRRLRRSTGKPGHPERPESGPAIA